jgi:hypothetical protein
MSASSSLLKPIVSHTKGQLAIEGKLKIRDLFLFSFTYFFYSSLYKKLCKLTIEFCDSHEMIGQ